MGSNSANSMPITNWRPQITALIITVTAALIGFTASAHGQDFNVQGVLWVDANGNGVREAGEGTLPGTRVHLMYVGPDGVAYTRDDELIEEYDSTSGSPALAAGTIRFTLGGANERYYLAILGNHKPRGYVPTQYRQGSPTTDSDLLTRSDLPAWVTDTFLIDYGATITGLDLGLMPLIYDEQLFLPFLRR